MFKLVQEPTFTHRIKVMVPTNNGHKEETFKATFRVLKIDESREYDFTDGDDTARFLRDVVVGLDDIADETGNKLEFSDELLNQVIAFPYARTALASSYWEAVSKARRGN